MEAFWKAYLGLHILTRVFTVLTVSTINFQPYLRVEFD